MMNTKVSPAMKINRKDKKRTAVCDRLSRTGVTCDEQFVEFSRNLWAWVNVDTGAIVRIGGGIKWIDIK